MCFTAGAPRSEHQEARPWRTAQPSTQRLLAMQADHGPALDAADAAADRENFAPLCKSQLQVVMHEGGAGAGALRAFVLLESDLQAGT